MKTMMNLILLRSRFALPGQTSILSKRQWSDFIPATNRRSIRTAPTSCHCHIKSIFGADRDTTHTKSLVHTTVPKSACQFFLQQRHLHSTFPASAAAPSTAPGSFDPLRVSSAITLRQSDDDLSESELKLKRCLLEYQQYQYQHQQQQDDSVEENDSTTTSSVPSFSSSHNWIIIWDNLQQAYMDLGYWQEALRVEETKCQQLYSKGTDEYADSIHIQGKLWLRQEDFQHSKPLYEQALQYFQDTANTDQQGHVLISLAGWYYFRNQLEDAMKLLQQAEPLLDTNPGLLVKCLDNQGLVLRRYGDFDLALDKYEQALQVAMDDETKLALQLHIADMLVALEEPDQAMMLYQQLVTESQRKADAGMEGVLWHNIATLHVQRHEYDLAVEGFRRSLHLKQATAGEDHPEVGKTWNSLGALHYGVLDEKLKALECFQHALWIARIHADDPQTDPDVLAAIQTISDIEQQLEKDT